MSNIVCDLCGLEGFSKCPYCRSIFTDQDRVLEGMVAPIGMIDAIFSHYVKIEEIVDRGGGCTAKVTITAIGDTPAEALSNIQGMLVGVTFEGIKILSCRHHWVFKEGCHSSIGCGH